MQYPPPPPPHEIIELSFNGRDYYAIEEVCISDWENVKQILLALFELSKTNGILADGFASHAVDQLHLRFQNTSMGGKDKLFEEKHKLFKTLTEKEKVVLYFIGTGNKRIDTSLLMRISINTLRQHQKSVYRKMGFHNKVQMAIWCSRFFQ